MLQYKSFHLLCSHIRLRQYRFLFSMLLAGYGNIFPYTVTGRIVCIFYALIGIPMTGWMLSCIGQTFHDKWQLIGKHIRKCTFRFKSSRINYIFHIFVVFLLAYSTIIVIPAAIISHAEDWTYIDAHYFCFISLTTIGFGDLAPMTWSDESNRFKQWMQTVMYVTYLLLGLSLLSVVLTAFLRKHEGQFKNAGRRMKRFVAHSARSATTRVKEAAERGHSPGHTPDSSFSRKESEKNEPKLLKVAARLTSVEDSRQQPYEAPWKVQSNYEKGLIESAKNPTVRPGCSPHAEQAKCEKMEGDATEDNNSQDRGIYTSGGSETESRSRNDNEIVSRL